MQTKGDVALMNVRRKKQIFDLLSTLFLCFIMLLALFLNLRHFSASCSH